MTPGGNELAWKVYEAFFDTVKLLLERGVTLVAEASFQHKLWAPKLEPLRDIARVRIVVCSIGAALARERHDQRGVADPQRLKFHHPWPGGDYAPPHLDVPTLFIDTSDGYRPDLDQIVSFARASTPSPLAGEGGGEG